MDSQQRFDHLQALLSYASREFWQQAYLWLLEWPADDPVKVDAIQWAREHTDGWSNKVRWGWLEVFWPDFPVGQPPAEAALLRRLVLEEPSLTLEHWATLASTNTLWNVVELSCIDLGLQDEQWVEMVASSHVANIQKLELQGNKLTAHSLQKWESYASEWRSLQDLSLAQNQLDDEAMAALQTGGLLSRLGHLDLSENQLTDQGLQTLVEGNIFSQCRELRLWGNRLTDASMELLLTVAPPFLQRLYLQENQCSEEAVEELQKSDLWSDVMIFA